MNCYRYRVFGLTIESKLELPELMIDNVNEPDAFIDFGQVPEKLQDVQAKGGLFEASTNKFLFKLDSVGAFFVENGTNITINPSNKSSPEEIRLFLLGSIMGALLHQRSILPIHGSAVSSDKGAIIIAGNSGVGKSTLAAGLEMEGYKILTDDISVIKRINGKFYVYPGIPHLKLWKDILQYMNIKQELERVRPPLEKYKKPFSQNSLAHPIEIKRILILSTKNSLGFTLDHVNGIDKYRLLRTQIYRHQYLSGLGTPQNNLNNIAELANTLDVLLLARPISPILLDDLVAFTISNVLSI